MQAVERKRMLAKLDEMSKYVEEVRGMISSEEEYFEKNSRKERM